MRPDQGLAACERIGLSLSGSIGEAGHEAANAAEALQTLDHGEEISVIFTDIDMPGATNGLWLARTVSERWPSVMIVITSGMSASSTDELPAGARFVPKPYVPEVLSAELYASLRN